MLVKDYPVVGFQVRNYPDNSVVGHAKRLAGWHQDVFISGGALLVDPRRLNGFFPPIYHEDWLCVLNHICAERRQWAVKLNSLLILRSRVQRVRCWKSSGTFSVKGCSG